MVFYSNRHKRLAKSTNTWDLKRAYEQSEKNLDRLARVGSNKDLKCAMKQHQDFEYALLYQQSPEFTKWNKKNKNKIEVY